MAGVSFENARASRRALSAEINMIPMIDLLMVTIAFLLVTAVWTESARLETVAPAGGSQPVATSTDVLHIDATGPSNILLAWKRGGVVVQSEEIRLERVASTDANGIEAVEFKDLAQSITKSWKSYGRHKDPSDFSFDRAVVHASNEASFTDLTALIDATQSTRREHARLGSTPAFVVTLGAD